MDRTRWMRPNPRTILYHLSPLRNSSIMNHLENIVSARNLRTCVSNPSTAPGIGCSSYLQLRKPMRALPVLSDREMVMDFAVPAFAAAYCAESWNWRVMDPSMSLPFGRYAFGSKSPNTWEASALLLTVYS